MSNLISDASLVIIIGLLLVWNGTLTYLLLRIIKTYRRLTANVRGGDILDLLNKHLDRIKRFDVDLSDLDQKLNLYRKQSKFHIQKIGFVRFNPFDDIGGDQSFALALLDFRNNGIVLSSLHGRSATRIYGKPVKEGGKAGYEFSMEEKEAIAQAIRS